jgi:hypothetical protein
MFHFVAVSLTCVGGETRRKKKLGLFRAVTPLNCVDYSSFALLLPNASRIIADVIINS